jgi:hypothetical protein
VKVTNAFCLLLILAFVACAKGQPIASRSEAVTKPKSSTTASLTSSRSESTCEPPILTPTFVPSGFQPASKDFYPLSSAHFSSWQKGVSWLEAVSGGVADRGEDPEAKTVSVRGHQGTIGVVATEGSIDIVAIDWEENTNCGVTQYFVLGKGVANSDLTRVARSMR